jgi:hypothetical protein
MLLVVAVLAAVSDIATADEPRPFAIEVVDDATGRGVPLVELRTVGNVLYVTDSAGLAAVREPGLIGQTVYFHVRSHGYEYPADGFGFRGKALAVAPGETATLRLKRVNIAERLYRVTGADIYRDSVLLGRAAPIAHPLLNAQVTGSDSVNTALFGGRVYWFWGDTNRLGYPLGSFHVPGATSRLPGDGGLAPERGVDLEYFTRADGFVANTCEMPGEGPTWIDGLCVVPDADGRERMFARYMKVRKFLDVYERGLVEFDAAVRRFKHAVKFDFDAPLYPHGHSLAHETGGDKFIYFGNPYPLVRVRANADAISDPASYEAFTCLAPGSRAKEPKVDRDENGTVRWSWKSDAPAPTAREQAQWLKSGLIKDDEAALALRDVDTGKRVIAHSGSVAWNVFRRRFVMIVEESEGTSNLGEIWYAEADTPTGPWVYARKIVTHDKYSFYNPRHHPMFDQDGGRRIFFEGTYSTFFSGSDSPTPRYDYNQLMYSLDLNDPRVVLPVAVYKEMVDGRPVLSINRPGPNRRAAFMALDRASAECVPVEQMENQPGKETLYGLSTETSSPAKTCVPLFVWTHKSNGHRHYAIADDPAPAGYVRSEQPVCLVWRYLLSKAIRFPP